MRKKTKRILAFLISMVLLIEVAMPNGVVYNRVKAENNTVTTPPAVTTGQSDNSSEAVEDSKENEDKTDEPGKEVSDTSETVTEAVPDHVDSEKQGVQKNKAGQNQGYQSASGVEIPVGNPEEIDCHSLAEGEELPDNTVLPNPSEGFSLTEDKVISGDLYLKDTTVELNGYTLRIKGNLYQENSDIELLGGSLMIEGDYRMSSPCLDEEEKVSYEPCDNGLVGSDAEEIIKVYGGFYVNCEARIGSLYGTMLVGGDFKVQNGDYGSNSFITKQEESRIILDGIKEQFVELSAGKKDNSIFLYRVELQNSSEEGVHFDGCTYIYEEFISNDSVYDGTIGIGSQTKLEDKTLTADIMIVENRELTEDLQTEGDIIVNHMLSLKQYQIICNNLHSNHYLNLNKGSVKVEKNLVCNGENEYAGLTLAEAENKVTIGGNLLLKGSSNLLLQRGTLSLMGDLLSTTTGEIVANGSAQFIFDGDKKQDIRVEGGRARIACLTVKNSSEEGVSLYSPIILNRVIYEQGQFSYKGDGCYGMRLNKNTELDSLTLYGGTLDLNGHKLTVHGDIVNHNGSIVLNDGTLIAEGSYTHCKESGCIYEDEACKEAALFMEKENDVLRVKGNLKLSDSVKESRITAGTIEAGGNVSLGTKAILSGTSTLILNGNKEQCIQGYNKVNDVVIDNPVKVSYEHNLYITGSYQDDNHTTNSNGYIMYTEELDNIVRNVWQGECCLRGSNTLREDITLPALSMEGELNLGGHTLTIENDFVMNGLLAMQEDTDYLLVKGDYRMNSSYPQKDALSKGKIEIQGNLIQAFGHAYETSGTHVTRLSKPAFVNGEMAKQMVTISGNEGPCVAVMELTKNAEFYSFSDELSAIAQRVTYDLVDKEPPTTPTNLTVSEVTDTKASLTWEASLDDVGVTGYYVYVNGEKVMTTSSTEYRLESLSPQTVYNVNVTAVDGERQESGHSESVSITTLEDITPPDKIEEFYIVDKTASKVTLKWGEAKDNIKVAGYKIYRDDKMIVDLPEEDGQERIYLDCDVEAGELYQYQISAYDISGNEGEKSSFLKAKVREPRILSISPSENSVINGQQRDFVVSWVDIGTTSGYEAAVEYKKDSEWVSLYAGQVTNNQLGFQLPAEEVFPKELQFRVTVADSDANQCNEIFTFLVDCVAPVLSSVTAISSENAKIILEWLPTQAEDFKSYQIYRKGNGQGNYQLLSSVRVIGDTKYEDANVEVGQTYHYYIICEDEAGNRSTPLNFDAVVVAEDEEKPEVISLSPESGKFAKEIKLNMSATDNVGIQEYIYEFRKQGEKTWDILNQEKVDRECSLYTWDISALSGVYEIRGYVLDKAGNQSEYSMVRSYRIDNTGIAKTKFSQTLPGSNYIGLQWDVVEEVDFSYYVLEEKRENGYYKIQGNITANGTYVKDLQPKRQYTYRVIAYDDVGNRGEPSDDITVTTLEDTTAPYIQSVNIPTSGSNKILVKVKAADNVKVASVSFAYSLNGKDYMDYKQATTMDSEGYYVGGWDCSSISEGVYDIGILVCDVAGNSSNEGQYTKYQVEVDHTAPNRVENVTAVSASGTIRLSFKKGLEEDIAGYEIYRRSSQQAQFQKIDGISNNFYEDSDVFAGISYEYKVCAVDKAGNKGDFSNSVVCQAAGDTQNPQAYILSPSANSSVVKGVTTLYARAIDNVSVKTVKFYYLPVEDEEDAWRPLGTTNEIDESAVASLAFDVSQQEDIDTSFYIKAVAVDSSDNSGESEPIQVTVDNEIPHINNFTVDSGNRCIQLKWDINQEEDFAGYEIYRRAMDEDEYQLLKSTKSNSYKDDAVDIRNSYQYKICVYDKTGNTSSVKSRFVTARDVDDIAPIARITGDYSVVSGHNITLSAMQSSDNVGIASYEWDMGDGSKRKGTSVAYQYQEEGKYKVTLKVTDTSGLVATVTKEIEVTDDTKEEFKLYVTDENECPIQNAMIILENNLNEQMITDESGYAACALAKGTYQACVMADNFEAQEISLHVVDSQKRMAKIRSNTNDSLTEINEQRITMVLDTIISADIQVKTMTLKELKEAGIDVTNPKNLFQSSFIFKVRETDKPYSPHIEKEVKGFVNNGVRGDGNNAEGDPGHDNTTEASPDTTENPEGEGEGGDGDSDTSNSSGYEVVPISNDGRITNSLVRRIDTYIILEKKTNIKWLKDFVQVKATITNISQYLSLTDCELSLDVPHGLKKVAETSVVGFINGINILGPGQKMQSSWILRGDEGGTHEVTVHFKGNIKGLGIASGINYPATRDYKTKVTVRGVMDSGLKMYIYPEQSMVKGSKYYIQYRLVNEGKEPVNSIQINLGEYKESTKTLQVIEWTNPGGKDEKHVYEVKSGGTYYVKKGNEISGSLLTRDGDKLDIEYLAPGKAVYGTHVATATQDAEYLEYLIEYLENEGAIDIVVKPIKSHVAGTRELDHRTTQAPTTQSSSNRGNRDKDKNNGNKNPSTTSGRPYGPPESPLQNSNTNQNNSSTVGDPVSVETGGLIDQQTIMQLNGGQNMALTMSYDSRYTENTGDLGKGWTHNYEQHIVEENGMLQYYENANSVYSFVSKEALDGTVYGSYDEATGRIILDNNIKRDIEYTCINAGIDCFSILKKENGSYELKDTNGNMQKFDEKGRMLEIIYRNGNRIAISYEDNAMVIQDTTTKGYIKLIYDKNRRVKEVVDHTGRKETFSYDENGCMISRTNPAGSTYQYTCDADGKILSATDGDGENYMNNTYDKEGRVLTQDEGNPAIKPIQIRYYDEEDGSKEVKVTNRLGETRTAYINADQQALVYKDAMGATRSNVYDENGRITGAEYENGTKESWSYNEAGDVVQYVAASGITYVYSYDENRNLLSIEGSDQSRVTYTYDKQNRCSSSTDVKGIKTTYTYNEAGQVLTSKVEGRGVTTNEYDEAYRLVKTTQPNGLTGEYTYDQYGFPSGYKDSEGRQIAFTFDEVGHLLRQKVKTGEKEWAEISATYNSYGAVASVTDANGNKTGYEYDANTLLIKETYANGTTKQYIRDAEGNIVKIIYPQKEGDEAVTEEALYDAGGNLKELTNTLGGITAYSYQGTLLTSAIKPEGGEASLEYDKFGRLTALTDEKGGKTSLTYDAAGRITTATDAAGNRESYTYDQYGQLIKATNPEGESSQLAYDSYGNLTKVTDARGNSIIYEYDSMGNRIKETAPEGQVTTYTYDKYNRITSMTKEAKDKENSQKICYTYKDLLVLPSATETNGQKEDAGIIDSITDAEGNTYKIGYDKAGNVTDVYDAYGNNIQHTEYDCMNQAVRVTDGNGSVTSYEYDGMGNITQNIRQLNKDTSATTAYQYIGGSLLSSILDAEGGQSSYTYDKEGNLTSIMNPNGGITSFTYDSSGNVTSEKVKGGSIHSYTYTANNLLKEKENSKGQKTKYTYDKTGRITGLTDEEGSIHYTYDENGNVLTVTEEKEDGSKATIKRTYDKANRVTSYTDAEGNKISYAYNELGQLITLTYPDGRKVTYIYDRNNSLTSVTDWEGRITNYTYNKNGQLSKLERADKTVETYEYDKAGQLVSQKDVDAEGKEIHSYDYTYNLAGNITKIDRKRSSRTEASDKDGKASGKESSEGSASAMEASGEAKEKSCTTVTMEYSDDNRLISYNGVEVKYDEEGNMTYGPLDGKMTEFVYDCRNRLIKAGDTKYGYDAGNNRVGVTKDGVTTKYVVDSNCEYSQVLTATTDDNVITYIYGDGLIAQESGQDYVTYHYNQVGSTTALTDEKGAVIETYEYSPYGDILDGDSSLTMFLYNGKYGVASDGNGLYYMRARYYDISIKRFVNQDVVIGHLDVTSSLNRYAYCEGNPVSYLDPFGLERYDTEEMHLAAGALSILAGKLTIRAPILGLCIATAANGFDIGLNLYDAFYDVLNGEYYKIMKRIFLIALDILGIVTAGISNNVLKEAEYIAKIEGRMTGYENLLSLKYDKWNNYNKISDKLSFASWLESLVEWIDKKVRA